MKDFTDEKKKPKNRKDNAINKNSTPLSHNFSPKCHLSFDPGSIRKEESFYDTKMEKTTNNKHLFCQRSTLGSWESHLAPF